MYSLYGAAFEKYRIERNRRNEQNLPMGEICESCHSVNSRHKSCMFCSKCLAPMKKPLGFVLGIPVYKEVDAGVLSAHDSFRWFGEDAEGVNNV